LLWHSKITVFKEYIDLAKRYDKQFKQDAIRYYEEHKELGLCKCAENLHIAASTLRKWIKELENTIDNERLISGNDCSNKCPEVKRLKQELHEAHDDIDALKKKIVIMGK